MSHVLLFILLHLQVPASENLKIMDVRSGLVVLLCLIGSTCAETVKFINCGKFHFIF